MKSKLGLEFGNTGVFCNSFGDISANKHRMCYLAKTIDYGDCFIRYRLDSVWKLDFAGSRYQFFLLDVFVALLDKCLVLFLTRKRLTQLDWFYLGIACHLVKTLVYQQYLQVSLTVYSTKYDGIIKILKNLRQIIEEYELLI